MYDIIVETRAGRVGGTTSGGVHTFKGIPYGGPTAGANRFKPPRPAQPWRGVRDATHYGPTAPQRTFAEMGGSRSSDPDAVARMVAFAGLLQGMAGQEPAQGEDCLVLNVWTGGLDTQTSRAVMVWLHGGAFESGSGSWPLYEGTPLAARGDAVVVTLNHRLGVLGFLSLDEIGGAQYAGSGNAGMLDIVLALEWVRDNIAAFGGDPNKVLVFGNSGGASKTATLLGMPAARGLFQRGAIMSGPMTHVRTAEHAAAITLQLLDRLKLSTAEVHKLHEVPYATLLAESAHLAVPISDGLAAAANPEAFMPMQPAIDGVALLAHPMDDGCPYGTDVAMLVGSAKDDMKMLMLGLPWFGNLTTDGLEKVAQATFGALAAPMLAAYRRAMPDSNPTAIACQFVTDRVMWAGAIDWAERKVAGASAPVYVYRFDFETPVMGGILGATHGGDIPFAFNNYTYTPVAGDRPQNAAMGQTLSEAFVRFAHTGNPNHAGLPPWRPYTPSDRCTMTFDAQSRIEVDPRAPLRELYAKLRSR
jgi:para-nitrobenzyl esterase